MFLEDLTDIVRELKRSDTFTSTYIPPSSSWRFPFICVTMCTIWIWIICFLSDKNVHARFNNHYQWNQENGNARNFNCPTLFKLIFMMFLKTVKMCVQCIIKHKLTEKELIVFINTLSTDLHQLFYNCNCLRGFPCLLI